MNTPEYLYHYTSLDTLALILENRTICFNNLLYVDDIEEAETSDMENFGKYICVSCWTDEKKEMIPMWNLYTPDMHGVRIRLPVFPFVKYQYAVGEFYNKAPFESYIDYAQLRDEDKGIISPNAPILVPVDYVDDSEKLLPRVRKNCTAEDVRMFLAGRTSEITVTYSFKELGRYKSTDWQFQKEWRYIITFSPMSIHEQEAATFETHMEFYRRIEDTEQEPPYHRFFLKLRSDAVEQMEVVFGPRMSEAEKILAKALLHKHGLDGHWRESTLRIR